MSLTLLQILDEVSLLSGVDTNTEYVENTTDAVRGMVSLANQSAGVLSLYPWQGLRARYSFDMTTDTSYSLPTDYRAFVPDSMYVDGQSWKVDFPTDTGEWSYLQSGSISAGAQYRMRLLGDHILINDPTSGDTVSFEYLSKYPILDTDLVAKQRFTVDTDTWRLNDQLIIMDILWRYKKLVGEGDWQVDLADFKAYELSIKGHDKGSQTLIPGEVVFDVPLSYYNIQT